MFVVITVDNASDNRLDVITLENSVLEGIVPSKFFHKYVEVKEPITAPPRYLGVIKHPHEEKIYIANTVFNSEQAVRKYFNDQLIDIIKVEYTEKVN